jgi:hypothetical protein
VAKPKAFLIRTSPKLLEAVQRWADDDLRSLNGQIEFLLRKALADAGRTIPPEQMEAEAPPMQRAGQPDEHFID